MPEKIGIAIFGLGRAGKIHLLNCIKHFKIRLVWLIDLDLNSCQDIISNYCLEGTKCCKPEDCQLVFEDQR